MTVPTHDTPEARHERHQCPGSGWCYRCGRPWDLVTNHTTNYTATNGCFPLCEDCWELLGHPEARIPYYLALVDAWAADGFPITDAERRALGRAVAAGK